ncbi:MAG: LexA family transcriptional regulator [Nitrospinae bacterium]|nr:LexA family transcriptional regulator [Nitrospinota bacterium]MBL7021384.1 LexA family transcriptional regulator [Nitrospinaceae bacterium]
MPKIRVWERIESLPESNNLAEFCRRVGLDYEKCKKSHRRNNGPPDCITLDKIARHFKLDLGWLITGITSSSPLDQRIGKKIKRFRKKNNWSLEEMGQHVSLSPQVLQNYENGNWAVSSGLLNDLAEKMNIPPTEFLKEQDTLPVQVPELKIYQANSIAGAPTIKGEDYISIPLTNSSIAARHPIIQENNIEDYVLLHIRAARKKKNLVASRVDGESMEPMLHSGDIVVIDRDDKQLIKNRIFAIFYDEGLTAKYVEYQQNLLILRPINPNSPLQIINLNEHPDPIVGRVIGAWKEL